MWTNETVWKTLAIIHLQVALDKLIHCRQTLELEEGDCKDGMREKISPKFGKELLELEIYKSRLNGEQRKILRAV